MVSTDREEFIVGNMGLVYSLAKRFTDRGIDYDDLCQAGFIGLIKAVDNFDESRGFQFSTYAVPVIIGEIKRLFRDGGAIKVSRALKEKSVKVNSIKDKFINENLREPTVTELSALCDMSTEELSEVLNVLAPVQSLSTVYDDESDDIDIPYDESDRLFNKLILLEAENKLTATEKIIIKARYYHGKTQSETAAELGLSQVQVSRREKKILLKLREYIK